MFWCGYIIGTLDADEKLYLKDMQTLYSEYSGRQQYHVLVQQPISSYSDTLDECFSDTLDIFNHAAFNTPAFDSAHVYKLDVKLKPIFATNYSVTNDSSMFVFIFFSPTKYDYLGHPAFLKIKS